MSILIVNDSPIHRNLIEGILRKAGYSDTIKCIRGREENRKA